jgi:hypothetical protein
MGQRSTIRDILQKRNIELHIRHDTTSLDDVADKLSPLVKGGAMMAPLVGIMRNTYARMGMKSTAQKSQTFTDVSYDKVVAATVLTINKIGWTSNRCWTLKKGPTLKSLWRQPGAVLRPDRDLR